MSSSSLTSDLRPPTSNRECGAEVLVRVEGVSKIFCRDLKKSLWYGLQDSARDLFSWGTRTPVPGASCLVPGEESLERPQGHDRLHKAQSTKHKAQSTTHKAQRTKHNAQSTKHKAQSTKHNAQSTKHNERGLRPSEFLAVDNVSFELKRGECLGLIGRNGAGKTTLLKMLNGLINPNVGRIEMRGRVGTPIVGGFSPCFSPCGTGQSQP
jgi:ABC-type multidrug transport system fused ATPase/permease subunit